jgi:hypothetical protein
MFYKEVKVLVAPPTIMKNSKPLAELWRNYLSLDEEEAHGSFDFDKVCTV